LAIKLRRGFKTEAEGYSIDFRKELSLHSAAPMDMFRLAELLDVPTIRLSELRDVVPLTSYELLTVPFNSPLSALTMYVGRRRVIVFNDKNAPTRQQSDLGHELAHAVLDHPPSELTNESGGRHYNKELEDEANCLSSVLLVPKAAAIHVAKAGTALDVAAAKYNISVAMMRMRLNQSGAIKIVERLRAY
jgi:Zn-dependent peptidase ImmA (M78 family)